MELKQPSRLFSRVFFLAIATVLVVLPACVVHAQTQNADCLECHDDDGMTDDNDRFIGVPADWFGASVHSDLDCVDCHTRSGDFDDTPHWPAAYAPVDCASCHEDETHSFSQNFHAKARARGNRQAPTCTDCHGIEGNAHRIRALDLRSAETACQQCHKDEAKAFDGGVHAIAAADGKDAPGCVSCHKSHGPGMPPAAGAVSKLCSSCHTDAIGAVERGGHFHIAEETTEQLNCSSCHDPHATGRPKLSARVLRKCRDCHDSEYAAFEGSVHADLFEDGDMNCVSCHNTHLAEGEAIELDAVCAVCH